VLVKEIEKHNLEEQHLLAVVHGHNIKLLRE
jgi:hypothetical protein